MNWKNGIKPEIIQEMNEAEILIAQTKHEPEIQGDRKMVQIGYLSSEATELLHAYNNEKKC